MQRTTNKKRKIVTASIYKSHRDASLGLGLRQNGRDRVIIYALEGPASEQELCKCLELSMRILKINNAPIQSLDLAVYIIQQAGEGMVTIVAESLQDDAEISDAKGDTVNKRDMGKASCHKRRPQVVLSHSESSSCSCEYSDEDDEYIRRGVVSISVASTVEEARALLEPCPPEGIAAGGAWGTHLYAGRDTLEDAALVSLATGGDGGCGPIIMCCYPQDEEPAYKVGRWVYAQDGSCIGHTFFTNFKAANIVPVYSNCRGRRQTHWRIVT